MTLRARGSISSSKAKLTNDLRHRRNYGRAIRVFGVSFIASILISCSPINGYPVNTLDTNPNISIIKSSITTDKTTYFKDEASGSTDAATLKTLRNRIVFNELELSEVSYTNFQSRLWGDNNGISTGGDLLVLAFSGIGATTGSVPLKSALAAASAGIVGAQGAINKDIYFQRTLPAIMAQMDANRDDEKKIIINNLMTKDDTSYPLPLAESDLLVLQRASGMSDSVQNITATASENQSAASESLANTIRTGEFSESDSAQRIRAWIGYGNDPTGKPYTPNSTNLASLQSWITANTDVPVAQLLDDTQNSQATETTRQQAISDLKIPNLP